MKKIAIGLSFLISSFGLFAQIDSTQKEVEPTVKQDTITQQQTTKAKEEPEINSLSNTISNYNYGGYGAFGTKYSTLNNTGGWMLGGIAAVSFQHKFIFGLGAYGLSSDVNFSGVDGEGNSDKPLELGFSYGGFFFEYSPKTAKTFHLSYPVFFGWGKTKVFSNENGIKGNLVEESKFFMVEPTANLEVNISETIRIYGGVSTRFVFLKDELSNLNNDDLGAFVLNAGIKIGRF